MWQRVAYMGPPVERGGVILMKSSMRRMVMAASVAKRSDFTLDMAGSTTPARMLFTTCTAHKRATHRHRNKWHVEVGRLQTRTTSEAKCWARPAKKHATHTHTPGELSYKAKVTFTGHAQHGAWLKKTNRNM